MTKARISLKTAAHHALCAVALLVRWSVYGAFIAGAVIAVGTIGWQAYSALIEFGPALLLWVLGVVAAGCAIFGLIGWAFWMEERCR